MAACINTVGECSLSIFICAAHVIADLSDTASSNQKDEQSTSLLSALVTETASGGQISFGSSEHHSLTYEPNITRLAGNEADWQPATWR